jgi:PPOX class probable F420-dependent enzyme
MSLSMTRRERERFLAEVHVAVLAIPDGASGPLLAPIWYDYTPASGIWFVTDRDSRKGRALAVGARVSLCVQVESPPYRYVSVEGPVASIAACDRERHLRPMAARYLGAQRGAAYAAAAGDDDDSLLVHVRPERWRSVDYGKR